MKSASGFSDSVPMWYNRIWNVTWGGLRREMNDGWVSLSWHFDRRRHTRRWIFKFVIPLECSGIDDCDCSVSAFTWHSTLVKGNSWKMSFVTRLHDPYGCRTYSVLLILLLFSSALHNSRSIYFIRFFIYLYSILLLFVCSNGSYSILLNGEFCCSFDAIWSLHTSLTCVQNHLHLTFLSLSLALSHPLSPSKRYANAR